MKRLLLVAATAASAALGLAVLGAGAAGTPTVIHVIEHATTDTVTDTGAKGDSVGDLLTFANAVYDRTDTKRSGHDQGLCTRTVVGSAWECWWTTFLVGGQITVEGPFYDKRNSVLAITGGTGSYADVRGYMELRSRAGGTKYDFVFHLMR